MGTMRKFLFDTAFDSRGAAVPRPRTHFTAAELEAARGTAEAAGFAAGRAAALAEAEARAATAFEPLRARADADFAAIASRHEAQGREALAAAGEIVRRLFPALAERHGLDELEALVGECLRRLHDEPRVVVRVADGALDAVKARVDRAAATSGFAGKAILLGDPALADGDARIEWAEGGVERRPDAVWAEIDDLLRRHLAGADAPSAT